MLDAGEHMALLLRQARVKREAPADGSFLPVSLALACLLRRLPPGLAPPSGSIPLHELDALPSAALDERVASLVLDSETNELVEFVAAIVRYLKVARVVLAACHAHLARRVSADEAAEAIVAMVADALMEEGQDEDDGQAEGEPVDPTREDEDAEAAAAAVAEKARASARMAMAVRPSDPVGIVKRAAGRDTGDGRAIVAAMDQFPGDERVQALGMRALKGVLRAELEDRDDDQDDELVSVAIDRMTRFPDDQALQHEGLACLAASAAHGPDRVARMAANDGVQALVRALESMPDDLTANISGLAVLAHPTIAGALSLVGSIESVDADNVVCGQRRRRQE